MHQSRCLYFFCFRFFSFYLSSFKHFFFLTLRRLFASHTHTLLLLPPPLRHSSFGLLNFSLIFFTALLHHHFLPLGQDVHLGHAARRVPCLILVNSLRTISPILPLPFKTLQVLFLIISPPKNLH